MDNYAKLRDALYQATHYAVAVDVAARCDDGGTCNFDAVMLYGRKSKSTERIMDLLGLAWFRPQPRYPGGGCYVVSPPGGGQGASRTRCAEAMARSLQASGYRSIVWYQTN